MTIRSFTVVKAVLLLAIVALAATGRAADAPRRPNIVLILADDLGYTDLACYGSSFYETPNLDRLAKQGMRFTNAYSACQVCSPTRASIMTGQYPARVGITNYIPGATRGKLIPATFLNHLPLETPNLARTLQQAGYATWHFGKWHLGTKQFDADKQGFDSVIGTTPKPAAGGRHNFSPFNLQNLPDGKPGSFITDALGDEAVKLIRDHHDKPFFVNFWSYAPHVPITAPKELVAKYEAKAKAMGIDAKPALREDEFFPIDKKSGQHVTRRLLQSNPTYAGMIENLDQNVGKILKAIDDAGQTDNTIVIFASDNGGLSTAEGSPTDNTPMRNGKGWMHEGGIRVPLIVRWPGVVKPESTSDVPVITADFFPTLCAATKVPAPANAKFDGVSLLPILKGDGTIERDALYWHYPHYGNQGGAPAAAVRSGDWKLIEFFEGDRFELYNLKDDLSETKDRAKEHPEIVEQLKSKLKAWQTDVGAKFPTPNPDYNPNAKNMQAEEKAE